MNTAKGLFIAISIAIAVDLARKLMTKNDYEQSLYDREFDIIAENYERAI